MIIKARLVTTCVDGWVMTGREHEASFGVLVIFYILIGWWLHDMSIL